MRFPRIFLHLSPASFASLVFGQLALMRSNFNFAPFFFSPHAQLLSAALCQSGVPFPLRHHEFTH